MLPPYRPMYDISMWIMNPSGATIKVHTCYFNLYYSMQTPIEYLHDAEKENTAVGHFNFAAIDMLWGIFEAAKEHDVPVFLGTSEGERGYVGPRQAVALTQSLQEQYGYPVFLNADHTYDIQKAKHAVDLGYDSVIIDGADLEYKENVKKTKEIVEYAKASENDVSIEGELGYIGASSTMRDEIPDGAEIDGKQLVQPELAKRFVDDTGIDMLAPAVGNIHGMLKGQSNPDIHEELIADIRKAAGVPLVLHGGSGVTDEDFRAAIKAGISLIHVSTEIRVAYRDAIQQSLTENPQELAPYRYMAPAKEAVTEVVSEKIELFKSV